MSVSGSGDSVVRKVRTTESVPTRSLRLIQAEDVQDKVLTSLIVNRLRGWCAWKNSQMGCNFAGFVRSMTCSRSFWGGGFLGDLGGIRAGGCFLPYPYGTRARLR